MVSYNATGLDISGITGAIDAWSRRKREEDQKLKDAQEVGAFGDRLLGTIATSGGAGGGAPSRAAELIGIGSNPEIREKFVGTLREGGLTNPYGLAAFGAYAERESGYSPKNITGSWSDPSERGAPGTSGGILSWRGDRLANMRRHTAGESDPVVGQAKFALTENPQVTAALQNAKSPEEANSILANAWRFAGYTKSGGENAARLALTRQYVSQVNDNKGSPGVAREAGTQQVQVASAADADMRAPGGVETGQFSLPGGRGSVAAGGEVDPQRLEILRQGIRSTTPQVRAMAMQEIQAIRAAQAKGPEYETVAPGSSLVNKRTGQVLYTAPKEGRTPEAVAEFNYARERGWTQAKTPVEYAAEKARILAEEKPKGPQKLTEAQERNRGLFVTAVGEIPIVDETFDSMGDWQGRAGEAVAGMTGYRGFTPENYQRGADAIERIAQASLYSTSGATAPVEEVKKTAASVTPMPGEGTRVRQEKRDRLNRMIEGIKQKAAMLSGEAPAAATPATPATSAPQGDGWTDVGGGFKIREKK